MKYQIKSFMVFVVLSLVLVSSFTVSYLSSVNAIISSIMNKTGEGKYPTKVIFKIDGIDYSTEKIIVEIITNNGQNISKIINPIPLLNPEDDENGIIQIPIEVEKGLLDMSVQYTGCVKVVEDANNFGNKISCQHRYLSYDNNQDQLDLTKSATKSDNMTMLKNNENSDTNSSGYAIMRLSL